MYIPLNSPGVCASPPEPLPVGMPTWRDIPQNIRLRSRLARALRRRVRRARVWLGLDWPLGIEHAAEALHYKFQVARDQSAREPKGGAK